MDIYLVECEYEALYISMDKNEAVEWAKANRAEYEWLIVSIWRNGLRTGGYAWSSDWGT